MTDFLQNHQELIATILVALAGGSFKYAVKLKSDMDSAFIKIRYLERDLKEMKKMRCEICDK